MFVGVDDSNGGIEEGGELVFVFSLIHKSSADQFIQEELDVSKFGVSYPQRLEETEVSSLDGHEDIPEMFQVGSHQVQGFAKVFKSLTL